MNVQRVRIAHDLHVWKYILKMNPLKCSFGVSAGNFLGFLVHQRGIEVDKNKTIAVLEEQPPSKKKELQRFLGHINFRRRFISNLTGKVQVEYEAVIIVLEIIKEPRSMNHRNPWRFPIGDQSLRRKLLEDFDDAIVSHVPKRFNTEANELDQVATIVKISQRVYDRTIIVPRRLLPSVKRRALVDLDTFYVEILELDWRHSLI
ncbi:uncharacterized protein LOC119996943 [Tripterygium wilfordii]|uniref:uncharacterized protein LOC119996943 n=1 Tax=Tripterygium wilfordii TaxID=458696 RepID=UPI0018F7F3DD|nr:uncharacterized protein LOC119996943 [Tripterygium wilfordii]